MVAVAIFSTDPVLRRNLEQLPHDDPAVDIVGMVDQSSSLRELVTRDRAGRCPPGGRTNTRAFGPISRQT